MLHEVRVSAREVQLREEATAVQAKRQATPALTTAYAAVETNATPEQQQQQQQPRSSSSPLTLLSTNHYVLAKLLAHRVKHVQGPLVSQEQTAFWRQTATLVRMCCC
jgi:hypothetical protein